MEQRKLQFMKTSKLLRNLFANKKNGNKFSKANKKAVLGRNKLYLALGIFLLCPLTLWGTTQNFNGTMMILVTFALAYLSKGMRKSKSQHFFK
jgi:uncharacterized membrane protein YbaN (DUF454 family)